MYIHIIFVAVFIAEIQHNVFTMQNVLSSFNFEHFISFHFPPKKSLFRFDPKWWLPDFQHVLSMWQYL